MKIVFAKSMGFCPGVVRALKIGEKTGKEGKKPVNVLKDIVHNPHVVAKLKRAGLGSVKKAEEAKSGTLIFSAHGVSPQVRKKALKLGLSLVDATCPLVLKVHKIVKNLAQKGWEIILIGDKKHDEIMGIMGEAPRRIKLINTNPTGQEGLQIKKLKAKFPQKLAVVTQTTLSSTDSEEIINLLRKKYPQIQVFNTICQATKERQKAVKNLAKKVDLILVIGSSQSANSQRLAKIAQETGTPSLLLDNAEEIREDMFRGIKKLGITAGASTPEWIVKEVVERIKSL